MISFKPLKNQMIAIGTTVLFVTILSVNLTSSAQKINAGNSVAQNSMAYGKYSCTASKYVNGSYEFIPRGSFTINKNGKYVYYGFEKPSSGTFIVDKQGNLLFKGGYFDGGKAEKTDRPNKFFLVFPTIPDNRWTCSLLN